MMTPDTEGGDGPQHIDLLSTPHIKTKHQDGQGRFENSKFASYKTSHMPKTSFKTISQ